MESEDFVDVIDAVVNQVHLTKSELKLEAFKRIIVNAIISKDNDKAQLFINLTSNLHDKQIEILKVFIDTNESRKCSSLEISKLTALQKEKEDLEKELIKSAQEGRIKESQSILAITKEIENINLKLNKVRESRKKKIDSINAKMFHINDSEFNYFKRDLISKGLLIENSYVSFSDTVVESIDATDFAMDYFHFIALSPEKTF